jgi:Putative phage serine protease XkdF
MPYLDTYSRFGTRLRPLEGEKYSSFMARVVPAIMELSSDYDAEAANCLAERAWSDFILETATEATIRIKRNYNHYVDGPYLEGWFSDWEVEEVLSANVATMNITYSAVEKAKASTGEVFKIAKSAEDQQLVFGWANIAIDENGEYPLDWDGDITAPEDLEKAAYDFVLKYRATGEAHQGDIKGQLVESVMFTKEKQQALGIPEGIIPEGWWCGFHIPDKEVFAKIKSGEYEMFSVEGSAKRLPTGQ